MFPTLDVVQQFSAGSLPEPELAQPVPRLGRPEFPKNLSLMCSPAFSPPLLTPILEVLLVEKE